jgi:hypothetical protein
MAIRKPTFGFMECVEQISDQKYGAALRSFKSAVDKLLRSKSPAGIGEVGVHLQNVVVALEETLQKAYGNKWDAHIPSFREEPREISCSFCAKEQHEVQRIIEGPSVHICDQCVKLCSDMLEKHPEPDSQLATESTDTDLDSNAERLCGICMQPRADDELVFLPHAAYLCAECLEVVQAVREKRSEP